MRGFSKRGFRIGAIALAFGLAAAPRAEAALIGTFTGNAFQSFPGYAGFIGSTWVSSVVLNGTTVNTFFDFAQTGGPNFSTGENDFTATYVADARSANFAALSGLLSDGADDTIILNVGQGIDSFPPQSSSTFFAVQESTAAGVLPGSDFVGYTVDSIRFTVTQDEFNDGIFGFDLNSLNASITMDFFGTLVSAGVPAPAAGGLMLLGLAGVGLARRRAKS
ncbi:MAG: PEP-CTERM sorting domain-containing protein [Rhodobacteraceae bacterium]|nr:PEP-CTERM sorting domain-containing protein [Paracoccaceae bacterium]